jgi:UrcA family protein
MFAYWLLTLAAASSTGAGEQVIIVEERPSVRLSLAGYDLGRQDDLRRVKRDIGSAADRVCARGYRDATYPEIVACVKGAAADAEAQLSVIVAHNPTASPLLSAIAVTAPK